MMRDSWSLQESKEIKARLRSILKAGQLKDEQAQAFRQLIRHGRCFVEDEREKAGAVIRKLAQAKIPFFMRKQYASKMQIEIAV
ncbi:hypothetical protein [Brevibacillus dissolubilis]|uniref:hypothetical protein n=1 Tax=Brevibacillus dissolubilis TaxID=1844116 RepID=UPI0011176E8A|nr:hypothetical protein [Brevibacillus dissolubilis]